MISRANAANLGQRPRAVRRPGRVADVDDRLVRQLVEHGACHREAAEARVEDAEGCVRHSGRVRGRGTVAWPRQARRVADHTDRAGCYDDP